MRNKILLLTSLLAVIIFTACNKGGKTGLLVPNDAAIVLHVDLSSLSSKLSWDEIKQTAWFAEAKQKATDSLAKILLNDPAASGIDTQGSIVFFMKRSNNNGYMAVEGKLKDAAKFAQMMQQTDKGNIKIEKDGEYSYVKMPDNEKGTLYFNDKMFVLIADMSEMNKNPLTSQPGQKYSFDSLKLIAKSTFALKGSDLLDSDKRFADLIDDKADMHFWMNSGNLYGGMMSGVLSMMKFNELLEGNISTGKVNFENGKIVMNSRQFYGKQLSGIMSKYGNKEVSNDLLSRLPEQNVLAAFAFSFNPESLKDILKLTGLDGMANGFLGQQGLTIDDFIKASKGDLAFALTGLNFSQSPSNITLDNGEVIPYEKEKTEPNFIFGASVNDKAVFQKIIDVATKLKQQNNAIAADTSTEKVKNKLQDKWFALASSDAEADAFLTGGKKPAYSDIFKGHNVGMFVDIQKLIIASADKSKDSASKKMIDLSAAFWKNATMYGDYKGKEGTGVGEINLMDSNTNALKQLNKYIDEMYKASSKRDIVDATVIASPTAVEEMK